MKCISLLFCLTVLSFSIAFGQDKGSPAGISSVDTQKTQMLKMEKMIGNWSGAGWIQQGKTRDDFTGTENVQRKLDGVALLVEGRFTAKNEPTKVIHETLAVLTYDPVKSVYNFNTFLANGNAGNFNWSVNEKGYEWGMNFPGSKILYTITIKDGIWNEIGRMSRDDGKTWFQFFEMNLKKS